MGARAIIKDYVLMPRVVPSSEIDWGMAARLAR
jgi:hypothetical protein